MENTAKVTSKIGWALAALGLIGIVGSILFDLDFEIHFKVIAASLFFYIPGIILWVLGHVLGQLDQRMTSLEEKIDRLS